jgi:hypothetical protein
VEIADIERPMVEESEKHHHMRMLEKLLTQYRRGLMTPEEYAGFVKQEIERYAA